MKPTANFRLIVATVFFALGILLLENKRNDTKRSVGKGGNKDRDNRNTKTVSSTEYIFFESLSKNLFMSLQ